ncbi:MAG: putative cell division protein FtsQ [Actinomycetota bacterium]
MTRREHDPSDDFSDDGLDPDVEAELAEAFAESPPPVAPSAPPSTPSRRVKITDEEPRTAPPSRSSESASADDDDAWGFFRRRLPRISIPRPSLPRPSLPRPSLRGLSLPRPSLPRFRRSTTTVSASSKKATSNVTTTSADGRTRVVITDDTAQPTKVSGVSGQARFRERRIAARRAEGRRRLRIALGVGGVAAVVVIVLLILASPILSIRTIDVEGVVYADADRVGEVVASLRGDPILTADLNAAERALESIPWVREARVSMHLPRRVSIQIDERTPIAFYRAVDGFNRVIDIDGRVLDVIEGDPVDFPPVLGTGPNLSAGDVVGQPFLGAAQLVNALPRDLRQRLVSMSTTPDGEVSFQLSDDVTVLFGRPDRFQDKLVALVNEIKRQGSRSYSIIDVSSGEASVR